MLSVSFFCTRTQNLNTILKTYQNYDIIDEILVVSLMPIKTNEKPDKIKIITMKKDSDLGLLSRYTFALSCRNRFCFIQDDDWVYEESILKKLYEQQEPLTGCHPRWFYDDKYQKQPQQSTNTAPILLTCGVMVDTWYLPAVIQDAKQFWPEYDKVFNGEDIFMSRAISRASGQKEFKFFNEGFKGLEETNPLWKINDPHRTDITKKIYGYFNES